MLITQPVREIFFSTTELEFEFSTFKKRKYAIIGVQFI